jgi:nucleoside-diphosphate-sugar epimerase
MKGKRVVVTGGSGKAGRYVLEYLLAEGYSILNLDIVPLTDDIANQVHTLKVDLADSGQVYSSLMSHFRLTEPFNEPTNKAPDAVIHLAGYARNMIVPDNETFRGNTMGTYNILEACCRLGVPKVIIASSICAYGVTFAEGDADFDSFPITEDASTRPMDAYSMSKCIAEQTAAGFARKFGIDIYCYRIGPLIAPNDYERVFKEYVTRPEQWKVHAWCYTDARDLGQMCHLGIEKSGLGFQIFNATNDHITNTMRTAELLQRCCPRVPITRELIADEAPLSNQKIRELLGFREKHDWKQNYKL